jgi:hypothetical protein
MKLSRLVFGLMAAVMGWTILAAAPAGADAFYDRYRGARYYRGRDRDDIRRREILRSHMFDLADRIRLADREGVISRRKADDLFEDLDDVRDFLRGDRYLTDSEFDRRRDDLRDIEDDLRDAYRRRGGRYDRYDRYDRYRDRYDRRDDYYYRR